jgi:zinc transporter ZupT
MLSLDVGNEHVGIPGAFWAGFSASLLAGVASDQVGKGIPLTIGIGLQNIPEGLAVAAALVAMDYPKRLAL